MLFFQESVFVSVLVYVLLKKRDFLSIFSFHLRKAFTKSQNDIWCLWERARTGLLKDLPTNKQHPSYWTKYRITRLRNSVRKDKLQYSKANELAALAKTYSGGNSSPLTRHHAGKRGNEAGWCTGLLSCLQTDILINRTDWEKNRNA